MTSNPETQGRSGAVGGYVSGWNRMNILGMLIIALLVLGCGDDESSVDDIPPATPRWVAASADNIYPQQGIRADTVASDQRYRVRLDWYENSEPDLAGYLVYRTPEFDPPSSRYVIADLRFGINAVRRPVQSMIDVGNDALGLPANLLAPVADNDTVEANLTRGYYWELVAYDSAGNVSDYAERIYYRMINNPRELSVTLDTGDRYRMSWRYENNPDVYISYYFVRVYSAHYGPDSLIWYKQVHRYEANPYVYLNFDGSARAMTVDCTYVWQLNVVSDQPSQYHVEARAGAAVFTKFAYEG